MHVKNKEPRTHTNANTGVKTDASGKKRAAYQICAAGMPLSAPRLPRPPGSPRLGLDSVGNFVLFGRAGEETRRRG